MQPVGEKRTCEKFQIEISKTEGLDGVYADGQTGLIDSARQADHLCVMFLDLQRFHMFITNFVQTCYTLFRVIKELSVKFDPGCTI